MKHGKKDLLQHVVVLVVAAVILAVVVCVAVVIVVCVLLLCRGRWVCWNFGFVEILQFSKKPRMMSGWCCHVVLDNDVALPSYCFQYKRKGVVLKRKYV